MGKLILLRHGQSTWNALNLFTGWVDVPLSPLGIDEALAAGRLIKDIPIDILFTSDLIRAQMTALLAMSVHHAGKVPIILHKEASEKEKWMHIYSESTKQNTIPVVTAWQLNERMYGELQGLNKAETAAKFGADQVHIWRRSFDIPPPGGESLKMTAARSIPYFQEHIVPLLTKGQNVFVSAHGNSLRSIIMFIEGLSEAEVLKLELPTGQPLLYAYADNTFVKKQVN